MTEQFQRLGILGHVGRAVPDDELQVPGGDRARASASSSSRTWSTRARSRCTGASTAAPRSPKRKSSTSDHTSPSIYVEFPLAAESAAEFAKRVPALTGRDVSVLIWTTTPWTIPSNLAIAFHPEFDYAAYDVDGARRSIVAEALAPKVAAAGGTVFGAPLARMKGARARAASAFSIRCTRATSLGVLADYVTLDAGTGAVHTAPGSWRRRLQHRRAVRPGDLRADRPGGAFPRHRGALRRPAGVRREPEGGRGAQGTRQAVASRSVRAHVSALLALPQPGDFPGDVAVVHRTG